MTNCFTAISSKFSGVHKGASCGATLFADASAMALILGTALAVSIVFFSLIGIVHLISLIVLISLLVLVGNSPSRLRP